MLKKVISKAAIAAMGLSLMFGGVVIQKNEVQAATFVGSNDKPSTCEEVHDGTIEYKGVCGDINWSIDSNGLLLIEGDGDFAYTEMGSFFLSPEGEDYFSRSVDGKWKEHGDIVTDVQVKVSGVSSIKGILGGVIMLNADGNWNFPVEQKIKHIDFSGSDLSNVLSCENAFSMLDDLETVNMANVNLGNEYTISNMFGNCPNVKSIDLTGMKTDKVTEADGVFGGAESLTDLKGVENWNLSNVTTVRYCFENCKKLETLELLNWNISSKCKELIQLFDSCKNLKTIEGLSNWDVTGVEQMNRCFAECENLQKADFSSWDLRNVTDMARAFSECEKLTGSLCLTSGKIEDYSSAFYVTAYSASDYFTVSYGGDCTRDLMLKIYEDNPSYNMKFRYDCKGEHLKIGQYTNHYDEITNTYETGQYCEACGTILTKEIKKRESHNDTTTDPNPLPSGIPNVLPTAGPTASPTENPAAKPSAVPSVRPSTDVKNGKNNQSVNAITNAKIKSYKAKNLKKKAVTFSLKAKAVYGGKLTYRVLKGSSKFIKVNRTGKVTLKKKCKKATMLYELLRLKSGITKRRRSWFGYG